MIGMFSMLAEFEVDLKAERAAAAREAAAARGQHTGRPRKLATSDAVRARELKEKGMTATEIGKALGVSRATIYRYLIENASPEPHDLAQDSPVSARPSPRDVSGSRILRFPSHADFR